MPRRDAQVHRTLSRLLRSSSKPPPIWYAAMLAYPPSPLPPRRTAKRTSFDLPSYATPAQRVYPRPLDIQYPEDQIRQQFFRDHPFEAFRPRSLVEDREVGGPEEVSGVGWVRLRQRGRNPSTEDCIAFALNLHTAHSLPLSTAYSRAVLQFRTLRSEFTTSLLFAAQEAESYGAVFAPGEIARAYAHSELALQTHSRAEKLAAEETARAAKKWRMDPTRDNRAWTGGEGYMRRLEKGGGPVMLKEVTRPQDMPSDDVERREESVAKRWDGGGPLQGRFEESGTGEWV